MKQQYGVGFIPYEIGDSIVLTGNDSVRVITDIKMSQYVKDKKIEFEVELEDKEWVVATLIERRVIPAEKCCCKCDKPIVINGRCIVCRELVGTKLQTIN